MIDGLHEIGGLSFPDSSSPHCSEAAERWVPRLTMRAIHSRVLVVAATRIEGAWSAYVFPVAGRNHRAEMVAWRKDGMRLAEDVARAMFPELQSIPYAR